MKFITSAFTSLVVCLGVSGVLGATMFTRNGGGKSAIEACPTAEVVQTRIIVVDGHSINHTTFACPDDSLRKAFKAPPPSKRSSPFTAFEKRNAAECRTAAPECQCGQAFTCECQDVTAQAPAVGDCTTLANSFGPVAQTAGPTFITQINNFEIVTFQTCAAEFTNLSQGPLEYCWDEMASTENLVNQECFENGAGTAAACDSNNGAFLVQSLRVGS